MWRRSQLPLRRAEPRAGDGAVWRAQSWSTAGFVKVYKLVKSRFCEWGYWLGFERSCSDWSAGCQYKINTSSNSRQLVRWIEECDAIADPSHLKKPTHTHRQRGVQKCREWLINVLYCTLIFKVFTDFIFYPSPFTSLWQVTKGSLQW